MSTLFRSGSELQQLIGRTSQPHRGPTVIFWACMAEKELCPKLRAKHPTLDIVCSREKVDRLKGQDQDDVTIEKIIGNHAGDRYLIVTWSESHSIDWHDDNPVYKRSKKLVTFPANGATAYLLNRYIRNKLKKPSKIVYRSIDIENVRAAIREFCKPSGRAVIIVVGHNDGGCSIRGEVRHENGITWSETVDDLENISRILDFTDESSGATPASEYGKDDDVVKQPPVNVAMIRGSKAAEKFQRVTATDATKPDYFVARINNLEFSLVDVVCANASDTWLKLVRSIENRQSIGTPIGRKIAENLIRVAATRVFNSPEQSILELPVNAIDASLPGRPSIGKFGMGFFSLLYWLNGHPQRTLSVVSVFQQQQDSRLAYCLELYQTEGDFKGRVYLSGSDAPCGTVVCLDTGGDSIDEATRFAFKYHLKRLEYVRTAKIVINNTLVNKETSQESPEVDIALKNKYITVSDHGSGLPIDIALSALLTPSLSTKGIESTAARDDSGTRVILRTGHESHLRWESCAQMNPSIEIIVAGVVVYLPTTYAVASIEMPMWTPVPVARDNIIIDDRSRPFFTELIRDLIREAIVQSRKTPFTFYLIHEALINYAETTKQAALIIKEQLYNAYDTYASRIVLPQHLALYAHVRTGYFIAGHEMNREKVRDQVMKTMKDQTYVYSKQARPRIDSTVFEYHTTVFIDSTQKVSDFSGGLYGTVFMNQPSNQSLSEMQLALCADLKSGYQLIPCRANLAAHSLAATIADTYTDSIDELFQNADRWMGSVLFPNEDRSTFQQLWETHLSDIRHILQSIHDTIDESNRSRRVNWQMVQYSSRQNPAVEAVYSLSRMYSVYGHQTWMRVATAMADALRRLPVNNSAGHGATQRYVLSHNDSSFFQDVAGFTVQHMSCKRPPDHLISFDADALQYIWQQAHNIYKFLPVWGFGVVPLCMKSKQAENGVTYEFIKEIVELHAPITVKMNMLRAGYKIVRDVEVNEYVATRAEHVQMLAAWIKNYAYAFDFEVDYTKMSSPLALSVYEDDDYMIRLDARRAYDSLVQWSKNIKTGVSPALLKTKLRAHFINTPNFTTSQLVAHVMLREDSAENLVKTAHIQPKPPNVLQIVGIVINEGNTRDPFTAMLLELVQNAIDAMRLHPRENNNIFIDLEQAGKMVVLSVSDPVGMDYSALLAMHIPFYSSKSATVDTTGEMGTGFFNVYREAASVEVSTSTPGSDRTIVWTTYPQRATSTKRIVDLNNVVEEEINKSSVGGTRISIRLNSTTSGLSPTEIATNIRTTVIHTLSAVDTRLAHIYLRDVTGRMDTPINHGNASTRINNPSGQSVIIDENGFQCGSVLVTLVPRTTESYVMTNGVPFQSLVDFCRASNLRISTANRAILSSGFSVDLPRQSYEAVQSREWLRLNDNTQIDLYSAVLHMICIGAARMVAQVEQANVSQYEKQQALLNLERTYKVGIPGLAVFGNSVTQQFSGESDPILQQATPQHVCEMAADRLLYRYRLFDFPTLQTLLHSAVFQKGVGRVRVTYNEPYPYTLMQKISEHLTAVLPPLFKRLFASVLTLWLAFKAYDKTDSIVLYNESVRRPLRVVEFDHESNAYKMIEIFIRVYIEAAIKAKISGFTAETVKQIRVVDDPINTSSYYQIDEKLILINSRTCSDHSGDDLAQLATDLLAFARTHHATPIQALVIERSLASDLYVDLMGYAIEGRGAVCVHELEHARRCDAKKDSIGQQEGIHGTWTGVLCPSDNKELQERTFIECQLETFRIVATQEIDGLPFFQALLKRWSESMDV